MAPPRVISIQSFRQGTGKSTLLVNTAVWMAQQGVRVGLVECDFYAPSLHSLLGISDNINFTLNHYLWGMCELSQAVYTVPYLPESAQENLYLLPASHDSLDIIRMLRGTYHKNLLEVALKQFFESCDIDVMLIDTHAGLSDEALLSMAISDLLLVVLRVDEQHYLGTSVLLELAKRLQVPQSLLVVNELAPSFDRSETKKEVEKAFKHGVLTVLPHSPEMSALGGEQLISLTDPTEAMSAMYEQMSQMILR